MSNYTIPISLIKSKLNGNDLLLLSIIIGTIRKKGNCYKSNEELCSFLGWSSSKLGRSLNKLKNENYIKIKLKAIKHKREIISDYKYNELVGNM